MCKCLGPVQYLGILVATMKSGRSNMRIAAHGKDQFGCNWSITNDELVAPCVLEKRKERTSAVPLTIARGNFDPPTTIIFLTLIHLVYRRLARVLFLDNVLFCHHVF